MVDITYFRTTLESYLAKIAIALAILMLGYFGSKIAKYLLARIEKETVEKTENELDDVLFGLIEYGVRYVIVGLAVIFAAKQFGLDAFPVVSAALVVLFARPLSKVTGFILKTVEENYVKKTDTNADEMVFPLINHTVKYVIFIFAGIVALGQLGIQIVPFVAGLGIMGLAIAFAAKDTLANVISGIFLIIDQPFKVGDRIEVWSAPKQQSTWGDVIEIGLRTTKIRTTDNLIIIIPNLAIASRDIINYTTDSPQIRVRIPVGISYESDLEKTEKILLKIAGETSGVSKKPAPEVVFTNFGDFSVDLELSIWIENARKRRKMISEIGYKVRKDFKREGVEIPYPKRDIFIREGKPLKKK